MLEGALLDPSLYVTAFAEEEEENSTTTSDRRPPALVVAVVDAPPSVLTVNVADAVARDPGMAAAAGGEGALASASERVGARLVARARAVGASIALLSGWDGGAVDEAVRRLHQEVLRVIE